MSKKLITAVAAATLGAAALSTPAIADVSATAAYTSKYVFRGLGLGAAAANGSIDYSNDSGISAGIWMIDDAGAGDGNEFDLYAAYGFEAGDFDLSVGYTSYQYTYNNAAGQALSQGEVNLGAGFGDFALAIDIGSEEDSKNSKYERDYQHIALAYAYNDTYTVTLGHMDQNTDDDVVEDDEYLYLDITASGEVAGLDASLSIGTVDEAENAPATAASPLDGYMTITVSKTFDDLGL